MSELVEYHVRRLGELRSRRGNWNQQWEEAASFVLPSHRNSFQSYGMNNAIGGGGEKKNDQQYDSTAAIACQRFASVLESLTTPQSSIWHRMVPVDKMLKRNRSVRIYFDDVVEKLFGYRYRPIANFVGNSQQFYTGIGAYGNGVMYVDQPDNSPGLRYRNIHLGEAYFVENHASIVDTMYRPFWLTARQIVQKFGDAAPEAARDAAKNSSQADKKFEILHCVYPREDYSPARVDAKGMRFASLYMMVENQVLMREGGYNTFPYPNARYTQAPGEEYGRGPTQWVLGAIKTLNEEKRTVLKQGHRQVDPVLLTHDDGNLASFSLKAGALNAGGVNKDGKPLVHTLPVGNIAIGDVMMEMERHVINDAFLITLFQILIETPQMTATEVLERAREKGMLIAPTAGRLQAEFLGPMIEREIDLLSRQGLLPPPPPILQGQPIEYTVEYDSPLSRMQRAEKAAGWQRALGFATEYAAQTGDPEPLDWFDFDVAMPEIQDIHGAPTTWTRSEEHVAQIREQRAQARQEQQQIEAAPALASIMKTAPQQQTADA